MTPARQIIATWPWMRAPATRAVLGALRAAGGEVRFVGGCVRNAILGRQADDIDLATTLQELRGVDGAGHDDVASLQVGAQRDQLVG